MSDTGEIRRAPSEALREGLIELFNDLPEELRRSLSWDQGSEIAHHQSIADATGMPVFLCHAGRPWERPSNENTNGLLRDYFPKGTDLRQHSPGHLRYVTEELNQRPRKTLDWNTPEQLFASVQGAIM